MISPKNGDNLLREGWRRDRAVSILKEAGIESALVAAGGNVHAIGNKPDGSAWRVGITNPQKIDEVVGYVEIRDQAVDTSGDYEQFYTVNEKKYGHILDPFTGYPPEDVTSCTILASSSATADALATGIFAMGFEKGSVDLGRIPGIEGLIINSGGNFHFSQGFEEIFNP